MLLMVLAGFHPQQGWLTPKPSSTVFREAIFKPRRRISLPGQERSFVGCSPKVANPLPFWWPQAQLSAGPDRTKYALLLTFV